MTIEYPDQSYFPTWKVRLVVRLEEFDSNVVKSRLPSKLTKNLNGIKDDAATLETVPDPDNPGRFLVQPKGGTAGQNELVPEASSDDLTQTITGIIPKNFQWKQAGFRSASELKLQIRWSDLPLDPRVIRSVAVEFFLGTVSALEYAQGVQGKTRGDAFGQQVPNAKEPLNVVADGYLDDNGNHRTNLRFQGWVDEFKSTMGEDQPMIELTCKDNTSLLMNQIASPTHVISAKVPLDKAIADYLVNFPQLSGMTVEFRGGPGETAPTVGTLLAGTAFRPQLGPQPSKGQGDDLQVWDYITDVCGAVGLVNYLDGTNIIIARPSTVLDGVAQVRPDDPYKERKLASGSYPVRAVIFGKNLLGLEVSRKYGTQESKNIEVRCWSPRRKQLLVARYPTKADRIPSASPGTDKADAKWSIVRVQGVEDKNLLQQIAKDYYNGRNRNEIEVNLKTKNLSSFGGGNTDPDLLDLKAADPLEVLVDRDAFGAPAAAEKDLTAQGANEQFLIDLGYTKAFATAYANAYRNAGFQRIFRLREMNVSGDVDEGVSFELKVVNFVQVRGEIAT
jgi:hypothetical protein